MQQNREKEEMNDHNQEEEEVDLYESEQEEVKSSRKTEAEDSE